MFDSLLHRWLRMPYTLNVRHLQRPEHARATLLFIHGLGNTGGAWDDVIAKMPKDVRIITIDLLGFGASPKPEWALYDAKSQARSVFATLVKLRITTPVIIVGHSLGALVAVEMAKRYPILIQSLILCSPPFYDVSDTTKRYLPSNDTTLRRVYQLALSRPDQFLQLSSFAMKYNLINKSFNVTNDNVESYMATLKSMIINQTSYTDIMNLATPAIILQGSLDPFVVSKNIRVITESNPTVTSRTIIAGHEIRGTYISAVVRTIEQQLQQSKTHDIKVGQ